MKRNKRAILLSLVVLAIIIVVFPLVSLRYLNKGLEYRRNQLESLEDLGKAASFFASNVDGLTLTEEEVIGKITIVAHEKAMCHKPNAETIEEYVEKFVDQDAFRFVVLRTENNCTSKGYVFVAESERSDGLRNQIDGLLNSDAEKMNHIILIDRKANVRKTYDVTRAKDLESLVAHTTLLLPPLKKRG